MARGSSCCDDEGMSGWTMAVAVGAAVLIGFAAYMLYKKYQESEAPFEGVPIPVK